MKKLVFLILSVFLVEAAQAQMGSWQYLNDIFKPGRPPVTDDHVPIPFGSELPFPWNITQGIWLVKESNFESYFVIQATRINPYKGRLSVQQYDVKTCRILAGGSLETPLNTKVLWVNMKTTPQFRPYRLGLRAFKASSFPKNARLPIVNGQVLVLTLEALTNSTQNMHMMGEKLDNSVDMKSFNRCGRWPGRYF